MESYRYYILSRAHITDNPRGDYIGDTRRLMKYDEKIVSVEDVDNYMACRMVCDEAEKQHKRVVSAYKRWLKKSV